MKQCWQKIPRCANKSARTVHSDQGKREGEVARNKKKKTNKTKAECAHVEKGNNRRTKGGKKETAVNLLH